MRNILFSINYFRSGISLKWVNNDMRVSELVCSVISIDMLITLWFLPVTVLFLLDKGSWNVR